MEAFINEMVEPRVLDLIVLILPKWKLLIYIFLMNVIIFSPIYFFSVILIDSGELQLICPSVILFGFNLIHRALFVRYNFNNTRSMLLGVIFLSVGISTSGAVAMYSEEGGCYLPVVLLYGAVGGYGYHLVFSKMWKVLAKIFNAKKEMFVIKFLHSFGQAMAPLFLLVLFHCPWDNYVYGALLVLFGGILLHLIPITMLIANEKNYLKLDQDSFMKITEKGNESFYNDVAKIYTDAELNASPIGDGESEPMAVMSWKNPATYSTEENLPDIPVDLECDYDEDMISREGKYFNADGVEILEIIIEEDEDNIDAYEVATENTPGVKHHDKDQWVIFRHFFRSLTNIYQNIQLRQHVNTKIAKSVRFAVFELKFYSCLLLKSTDLCVFVLFLTLLPRFMSYHYYYRGKPRQMLLMSFVIILSAWATCSLLLLWCEIKFRKQQDKLLIFSILFKTFGYFCVYSTRSSFWTVSGCFLIGVGHAITCSYQDLVIKRKFTPRQWSLIKGALCLIGGLLVVAIGSLTNVAYVYCRVDNVLLTVLLVYCFSGSMWVVCNFKIIFR
ncbi:uncharacterized protein LOC131683175 [Topomyia yanbarensis]|uniref:uncharacterized protein LOC131683175 n=1 Tax=Topomyia yanbarensis TaxID=2498891 RepID=UPI00273B8E67|nr:uncharacterized protein LOC131683175 [Topomyia yanbarensis]